MTSYQLYAVIVLFSNTLLFCSVLFCSVLFCSVLFCSINSVPLLSRLIAILILHIDNLHIAAKFVFSDDSCQRRVSQCSNMMDEYSAGLELQQMLMIRFIDEHFTQKIDTNFNC